MTDQRDLAKQQPGAAPEFTEIYEPEPGLIDGVRFLYVRRVRLLSYFLIVFGIGLLLYLFLYFTAPPIVEGTIGLNFRGIEKQEYPSGEKFSVEDFRSPDLLRNALKEAGIPEDVLNVRELSSRLIVLPIIPGEVQARWKKQERDGTKREEYYPNEFKISIEVGKLNNLQRLRLFDAIVKGFQQRAKFEQTAALRFVASGIPSYEQLAQAYDFWDIPSLYRDSYNSLSEQLKDQIKETLKAQDPKYQLSFREISKQLDTWEATRLQAVEAVTYQGHLVKNRDIMARRISYRIEDLNIQIKQKSDEIAAATHLLEIAGRPNALLAGQLSNREGMPLVDANALERLVKSDYIGPVVNRIIQLQEDAKSIEAEKARLQGQLAALPKSVNITIEGLPSGYKDLLDTLSSELKDIVARYNRLVDEYLTATVSSLVSIRQSPLVTRSGYSPVLMLAGLFLMSLLLAVVLLAIENLFRRVKAQVSA